MKLEQQVCSLEYVKKLKELRVKQDSLWCWKINKMKGVKPEIILSKDKEEEYEYEEFSKKYCSAFTVAELGKMLPIGYGRESVYTNFYDNKWRVIYMDKGYKTDKKCIAKTEADARAKMLIYLLENKLIKL